MCCLVNGNIKNRREFGQSPDANLRVFFAKKKTNKKQKTSTSPRALRGLNELSTTQTRFPVAFRPTNLIASDIVPGRRRGRVRGD